MTDLQTQMRMVQTAIFATDYYTNLYLSALEKCGMIVDAVKNGSYTDDKIIRLANTFWEMLPDSRAIRREPFFALCDIAEHVFDDSEGDA